MEIVKIIYRLLSRRVGLSLFEIPRFGALGKEEAGGEREAKIRLDRKECF